MNEKAVKKLLEGFSVKKDMSAYLEVSSDEVVEHMKANGFTKIWQESNINYRYDIRIFLNEDKSVAIELDYAGFAADSVIIYSNSNSDFIKLRDKLRAKGLLRTPTKIRAASDRKMAHLVETLPVGSTVKHMTTGKKHTVLGHTRAGNVMITAKNYAIGKRSCKAYLLIPA